MDLADIPAFLATVPPIPMAALGGVLGLVFGSYLATLLVRWPQGLSASRGRSRCDSCARNLRWFELIPLISFLACRGVCRTCNARIDPLLPLMEALCCAAGAVFFALGQPVLAGFVWLLITLALFDLRHLWLPDRLVLALAAIGLLAPPFVEGTGLAVRIAGGLCGFAVLAGVGIVFRRVTGRIGMGGGDPKLFGAIGLWAGAYELPLLLLAACALGLAAYALHPPRRPDDAPALLPFGAYLCMATIILALIDPIMLVCIQTFAGMAR